MPGKPDPDRAAALQDWEEAFGSLPPPYLSVAFLRKALAYEDQCKQRGGIPASTRRVLRQVAEGRGITDSMRQIVRPGAHLVREWNGRTYQVEVLTKGFRDGRTAPGRRCRPIAKHITGTTWSGPRFFGLVDRTGRAS